MAAKLCPFDQETIDEYSRGTLAGTALETFEEHLLICPHCRRRVHAEDLFRVMIRSTAGTTTKHN